MSFLFGRNQRWSLNLLDPRVPFKLCASRDPFKLTAHWAALGDRCVRRIFVRGWARAESARSELCLPPMLTLTMERSGSYASRCSQSSAVNGSRDCRPQESLRPSRKSGDIRAALYRLRWLLASSEVHRKAKRSRGRVLTLGVRHGGSNGTAMG